MTQCENISILLIEDDAEDHRLLTKLLQSHADVFSFHWVEDLASGVTQLGCRDFDIILTDLSLPDSVGLETVSRLREHAGQIPILVLTSLDDQSVEHEILEVGAQDYLVKGELGGRAVARAILHAVQRQLAMNEATTLVTELEQSQRLLKEQTNLLHRKNQDLERLYKTAQEIVDNVSHDFRTPLTVIKDYVSILWEGMAGEINDEQRSMLDKVCVRADDLNNMVDDLLDASKLESGLLGSWRRSVDVPGVIERVASLLQQRAAVNGVRFEVDCPDDLPHVYCDADQISRVVTNLTANAIKYAGKDGDVRLWAQGDPERRQLVVGVTDSGPGIAPESLQKIFERFEQLGNANSSTTKGFGLGLNIAYKLCRLNLGELSVESQLGEGSTFSFTVPLDLPEEVLRRWMATLNSRFAPVRVEEITIPPDAAPASADDFDNFLNCFVRRGDLLLRVDDSTWELAMQVSRIEAQQWRDRAEQEYTRANRNRPLGPLPSYRISTRCVWGDHVPAEARLAEFSEVVQKSVPESAYAQQT